MALSKLNTNNCLSVVSPELSSEWDYQNNYPLTPHDVTFDDYMERGWICKECGNKWRARVYQRFNGLGKCLKCKSIGIIKPELIKEWDIKSNLPLTPFLVTPSSSKKILWICSKCNKKWITTVKNRYIGHGCPFLQNRKNKDSSIYSSQQ